MAEEKKVPFGGYPREEIQWRRGGPVAQRIRARGYEPRCRGFESLLARIIIFFNLFHFFLLNACESTFLFIFFLKKKAVLKMKVNN